MNKIMTIERPFIDRTLYAYPKIKSGDRVPEARGTFS